MRRVALSEPVTRPPSTYRFRVGPFELGERDATAKYAPGTAPLCWSVLVQTERVVQRAGRELDEAFPDCFVVGERQGRNEHPYDLEVSGAFLERRSVDQQTVFTYP